MNRAFCGALALMVAASAEGGSLSGQAKDLYQRHVTNVTLRVYSAQGALLNTIGLPQGSYNVSLDNFQPGDQAVVAEFSSPGRRTVSLTVSTETNNYVDVALPIDPPRQPQPQRQQTFYSPQQITAPFYWTQPTQPYRSLYFPQPTYRAPSYPTYQWYQPYSRYRSYRNW